MHFARNARCFRLSKLAELLDQLTEGRLSQSVLVAYFKRAFPAIPLDVMLASGGWTGVGGREMTDEQFNEAIRPWLVYRSETETLLLGAYSDLAVLPDRCREIEAGALGAFARPQGIEALAAQTDAERAAIESLLF